MAPIAFAVLLVPTKIENSVAVMSGSLMLRIVRVADVPPQWPAVQHSWNRFDRGYKLKVECGHGTHALLPDRSCPLHVGHRERAAADDRRRRHRRLRDPRRQR